MKHTSGFGRIDRRRLVQSSAALFGMAGSRHATAQTPASTGATRTVEHALGTTEVPAEVGNFIILDASTTLGYAMSLGMTPTHANEPGGRTPPFLPALYDAYPETASIQPLPEQEIDLEQVVGIAPDLIIAEVGYIAEIFEQLSQIAPTVALSYQYLDPWEEMSQVARALGVPEKRVMELRAEVDGAVEAARERIDGDGQSVSFATLNEGGTFDVFTSNPPFFVSVDAVERLGLRITPDHETLGADEANGPWIEEVSPELLAALDGDALVLLQATTSAEDMQAMRDGQQSPLYLNLPAVRNDRVLVADRFVMWGGGGIGGWLAQIDEFVEFLGS